MLYCKTDKYELRQGLMQEELKNYPDNSIDCIVTDPPYELNFMGKSWDNAGVSFQKGTWEHCFRVLKPGGYMLAFGGSRTFHRIACAIEDAGFEIRDTIMWLTGQGFPKGINIAYAIESKMKIGSANKADQKMLDGEKGTIALGYHKTNASSGYRPHDYSGQETTVKPNITTEEAKRWQGWHSNLKPAYEPIIVARKPCEGGIIDNVLKYGVGGINIDECRISHNEPTKYTNRSAINGAVFNTDTVGFDNSKNHIASASELGRYPANVILSYDEDTYEEVCGGFPITKSTYNAEGKHEEEIHRDNAEFLKYGYKKRIDSSSYNDEGSASRYFYCAKASKRDRDEGLGEEFEKRQNIYMATCNGTGGVQKGMERFATAPKANFHPCVKPTSLMAYLVRLVAPKGATILDPFMGSGSTGKAVMYENKDRNANYKFIGIEMTEEYLPIAKARIDFAIGDTSKIEIDTSITIKEEVNKKEKLKEFEKFNFII